MAFSQKTSTSNKLAKQTTWFTCLDWELKGETATELLGFFKAIFKDQRYAHDFTSQCQTEAFRASLSCKGQGLNTHMLIEIADGGAAVEEGKKKKI